MILARIFLLQLCLHVDASRLRGGSPEIYETSQRMDEKTFIDCQRLTRSGTDSSHKCDHSPDVYQRRELRRRHKRRSNIFHRDSNVNQTRATSSNPRTSQGSAKGAPSKKGVIGDTLLGAKKKGADAGLATALPSISGTTMPPVFSPSLSPAPSVVQTTVSPTSAPFSAANFQTTVPTASAILTAAPTSGGAQTGTPTTSAVTPWSLAPQVPSDNIFSRTHSPTRSPAFPPTGTLPSFSQVTFAPSKQTTSPAPALSSPRTTVPVHQPTTSTTAPSSSPIRPSPTGKTPSSPSPLPPSSSPRKICQLDKGKFGSLTGASATIAYQYEVQPFSNLTASDVNANLLPNTKTNLDGRLLPLLFPTICKDSNETTTNRVRRRTQEGFNGLSSSQPDTVVGTGKLCSATRNCILEETLTFV